MHFPDRAGSFGRKELLVCPGTDRTCFARDSTAPAHHHVRDGFQYCNQGASRPVLIELPASFRLSTLAPGGHRDG
jgi:hypothetical protein